MDDLISEFIEETDESLQLLDQELVRFEQNPTDKDILSNIFRVMHTIKGTCGFLGLPRLERVAHAGEDVLGQFRDDSLIVSPAAVSLILKCIDHIRELLSGLRDTGEEGEATSHDESLINELRAMAEGKSAPAEQENAAPEAESNTEAASEDDGSAAMSDGFPVAAEFLEEIAEATGGENVEYLPEVDFEDDAVAADADVSVDLNEQPESADTAAPVEETPAELAIAPAPVDAVAADSAPKKERPAAASQSIRVNVDVLENLMTMVSEMVLTRNQLLQLTRSDGDTQYKEPVQRLSRITSELQEGVMKTRMQPIGNAWKKIPRIVRDLTSEMNRQVDLVMTGEDTELDRQVLELIQDPLTHMIRNSVDHGIEDPSDRITAGKPEIGTIRLSAFHEGGHIIIQVEDDGKGLNTEVIRGKIVEKGLATAEEVREMDDARVNRFILEPGFSTAKAVTKVSGRGVGMDVVRSNIEKIGGTIDFVSTFGSGSTFTIKIPLTLAIVAALIVESSGQRFAIPQIAVSEVVRVTDRSEHRLETLKGAPVIRLRKQLLPLIDLNGLLEIGDGISDIDLSDRSLEGYVVVCRVGNRQVGVLVDKISDSEEIVVKPLSSIIPNTKFYSGNTILGDGAVILILDTNGLATTLDLDSSQLDDGMEAIGDQSHRTESILVFKSFNDGLCAVPLSSVHRIESFDMEAAEIVQGEAVIQYRGRLLPIMSTEGGAGVRREGRQTVLVFGNDAQGIGLAIEEIVDIMEDELKIQKAAVVSNMVGSAIVGGRAVDVINQDYFLEVAGVSANVIELNVNYGEAA